MPQHKHPRANRNEQILTALLTELLPTRQLRRSVRHLHELLLYEREGLSVAAKRARQASRTRL